MWAICNMSHFIQWVPIRKSIHLQNKIVRYSLINLLIRSEVEKATRIELVMKGLDSLHNIIGLNHCTTKKKRLKVEVVVNLWYLRSVAFVPEEIKDLGMRIGKPSGWNSSENHPIGLSWLCDFPSCDSNCVFRGIWYGCPWLTTRGAHVNTKRFYHSLG